MSRASSSRSGRSGNPKVAGSNLGRTVFEPRSSQTKDFKIDTCRSLAWHSALFALGKDNATEWDSR